MPRTLKIDPRDNVLVALEPIHKGDTILIDGEALVAPSDIPAKHKLVTEARAAGDPVMMYGVLVGRATEPIARGGLLHTKNLRHASEPYTATRKSAEAPEHWAKPEVSAWRERTFLGYSRADGQVGTRNYWLVVPLVFCENRNVAGLQEAFEEELGFRQPSGYRRLVAQMATLYREGQADAAHAPLAALEEAASTPQRLFPYVDGIRFLKHEGGCGGTREDSNNLCALIAGYLHHPNVAGATVLSLGCQHAQGAILLEELRRRNPDFNKPLVMLDQQTEGTEAALMERALRESFHGLTIANQCRRAPASLRHLTVGLKCGGSDGFSGISANPAIGYVSDLLAALGGRSILAEFPELCGVEQSMVDRCRTQESAERFVALMHDYEARAHAVRSALEMNPSPGNIQDGLITDAMKSAGAARKSGTSPVTAVLDYPEYATEPGLNLLCTPGNDVECVTGQVAAGANLVLFTTGLGTPTGNPITPVVKVATNSALATRMPDIIDIDTGPIVTGEVTIEQMGAKILDQLVEIASGTQQTCAELLGQYDFIPWKRGVSL